MSSGWLGEKRKFVLYDNLYSEFLEIQVGLCTCIALLCLCVHAWLTRSNSRYNMPFRRLSSERMLEKIILTFSFSPLSSPDISFNRLAVSARISQQRCWVSIHNLVHFVKKMKSRYCRDDESLQILLQAKAMIFEKRIDND